MPRTDVIEATSQGLHAPAGDFHIDPWSPVERAVITHAHSDHARAGHAHYLAHHDCVPILRARLGDINVQGAAYGEPIRQGDATVTLFPAGHTLGSAQVRVEVAGRRWVVSGDYKRGPDPTCVPFEPVTCDAFITECTFGLPIYRWPDEGGVFGEINAWWRANQEDGLTSVIYVYALGKAQRLLAGLDRGLGPILLHGAVEKMTALYREAGVDLPATQHADAQTSKAGRGRAMVLAPPASAGTPWMRRFGRTASAFASGWMMVRGARRRRHVDRGFVLSDHVDWPGLMRTIRETGASRIGLTHGYTDVVARYLHEQRYEAWVLPTRFNDRAEDDDEAQADPSPRRATDDEGGLLNLTG